MALTSRPVGRRYGLGRMDTAHSKKASINGRVSDRLKGIGPQIAAVLWLEPKSGS
jgi:hypothetical protein